MPSVARLMHDWHVLGAVTSSHDMVSVLARRGQLVEINGLQALSYPVFFTHCTETKLQLLQAPKATSERWRQDGDKGARDFNGQQASIADCPHGCRF